MKHIHLAVVGVCLWWRVWCGVDLTFGLAVGVGHGSVVVVAVRRVVAVVNSRPYVDSYSTTIIDNYCLELIADYRTSWGAGYGELLRKAFPPFSCLAFSASPARSALHAPTTEPHKSCVTASDAYR